jgi:L-asparaginase
MKNMPKVIIIGLGGTISCVAKSRVDEHYPSTQLPIADLIKSIPELNELAIIEHEQLAQVVSQDLSEKIWLKLANRVNKLLNLPEVSGIVITHGTDTMEETAYFLNLTVKSSKPVVLTGAMKPSNALGADGSRNLYCAVVLAASPESIGKSILLVANDTICGARDVTKTNVHTLDGFKGIEMGTLGYVQGSTPYFYYQPTTRHTVNSEFDVSKIKKLPQVDIVYSYIDSESYAIDASVKNKVAGIISAGFGKGTNTPAEIKALSKAVKKGMVVIRSSRVGHGVVTLDPSIDSRYGFIAGNNLHPQKARILLAIALTKTKNKKEIQRIFSEY